mgnify:CR=1 FL=1
MKKLYISFDLEGPFGMYPFIKCEKDLFKYKNLDKVINFLFDFHHINNIPATCALLGITSLDSIDQAELYLSRFKDLRIPNPSLLYNLDDIFFRTLISSNNKLFFKKYILASDHFQENKSIKYCSHTFSHIHFLEDNVDNKLLELDLKISKEILYKTFNKDKILDTVVLPRNQHDNNLIKSVIIGLFNTIRTSSRLKIYSENNNKSVLKQNIYKILRTYDRFSLPGSSIIQSLNNYHFDSNTKNDIKEIDSGYFLPFPKSSFDYLFLKKSLDRYLNRSIKFNRDISIWFHPHNLLSNVNIAIEYYKETIIHILSKTEKTHFPDFLE